MLIGITGRTNVVLSQRAKSRPIIRRIWRSETTVLRLESKLPPRPFPPSAGRTAIDSFGSWTKVKTSPAAIR